MMDFWGLVCSILNFQDLVYIYRKMASFCLLNNIHCFRDLLYKYHNLGEKG